MPENKKLERVNGVNAKGEPATFVKFEIRAIRGRATKDGSEREFLTYKVKTSAGKWIDCKFRKEVVNRPLTACIILVEETPVKMYDVTPRANSTRGFPEVWIHEIHATEALLGVPGDGVIDGAKSKKEAEELF